MGCVWDKKEERIVDVDVENCNEKVEFMNKDKAENPNSLNDYSDNFLRTGFDSSLPRGRKAEIEDFCYRLLKEINLVRTNPKSYSVKINDYIRNIKTDKEGRSFFCSLYNTKVNLPRGAKAFQECIEVLSDMKPLEELSLVKELKLPFPESQPELATSRDYISGLLLSKAKEVRDTYNLCWFHYDNNINNAEISIVLQLVDDNNSKCERRKHLLDPKVKYIGINAGKIMSNIYCIYFVFSS